jgi:hypothetical protein
MYAGERAASTGLSDNEASPHSHPDAEGNLDLSRAVEVIELANGETIWYVDINTYVFFYLNWLSGPS